MKNMHISRVMPPSLGVWEVESVGGRKCFGPRIHQQFWSSINFFLHHFNHPSFSSPHHSLLPNIYLWLLSGKGSMNWARRRIGHCLSMSCLPYHVNRNVWLVWHHMHSVTDNHHKLVTTFARHCCLLGLFIFKKWFELYSVQ